MSPALVLLSVQIVSHSSFLHFMMTNYGGQASTTLQGELHRWFENCEWRLSRTRAVPVCHSITSNTTVQIIERLLSFYIVSCSVTVLLLARTAIVMEYVLFTH
jgi:hypothetical protein